MIKLLAKLSLLVLILSACVPSAATPEAALTPGIYSYQDFGYLMTWSQDDSLLAVTTLTGLYVYDTKTYEQKVAFDKLSGSTVAFGKEYMAAINGDGLYVWSLKDYKLLFNMKSDDKTEFQSLAISPNGKILATGEQKQIRLWSLPDGKLMSAMPVESYIPDLVFKNNDALIATDTYLSTIQEWNIKNQKMVHSFELPKPVISFTLGQDGKVAIVDYGNNGFELWNADSGKIQHNYSDIVSASGWQGLSGNNQYVVVWGYALDGNNSGLSVWDLSTHVHLQEFTTPFVNGDGWRCGALNSDGSVLAASNNEGYIYFYNAVSGKKLGEIFLPYKYIVEKG